ncbi:MAG TPA: hypothetical protein PKL31_15225 [Fulvivirga sp.]|nr:hypothetical protein [Fulvivirga sp.]
MDFVNHLIDYFKKPDKETKGTSPNGTCPVCWGHQEYQSKIRKIFKDKQIDVNNHKDSYMKIQKFVVKYINGIKLRDDKVETCPTCGSENCEQD